MVSSHEAEALAGSMGGMSVRPDEVRLDEGAYDEKEQEMKY